MSTKELRKTWLISSRKGFKTPKVLLFFMKNKRKSCIFTFLLAWTLYLFSSKSLPKEVYIYHSMMSLLRHVEAKWKSSLGQVHGLGRSFPIWICFSLIRILRMRETRSFFVCVGIPHTRSFRTVSYSGMCFSFVCVPKKNGRRWVSVAIMSWGCKKRQQVHCFPAGSS